MAYSYQTFSVGEILTATKMNQMSVNIRDHVHGAAGVALVDQGSINGAAVGQGQLKATSGLVSSIGPGRYTLPGGYYTYYPNTRIDGSSPDPSDIHISYWPTASGDSGYSNIIYLNPAPGVTLYANVVYLQASPPYNLGDGEIPLFLYADVDAAGDVVAVYCAPEAPWHYNGPTSIKADYYLNGVPYKRVCIDIPTLATIITDCDREVEPVFQGSYVDVEITQEMKNADMVLIPHPFLSKPAGRTAVLIDPVSDLTAKLAELHAAGESVNELLHRGYLRLGNTPLDRKTPPGVIAVAASWRLKK